MKIYTEKAHCSNCNHTPLRVNLTFSNGKVIPEAICEECWTTNTLSKQICRSLCIELNELVSSILKCLGE